MKDKSGVAAEAAGPAVPSGPEPATQSQPEALVPNADDARIEYRFSTAPWGRERHDWIIASEAGAINIWAEPDSAGIGGRNWYGGIECHYAQAPEYMNADTPSQAMCWLLNAPCWHDGSSLQFSEQVAPMLPAPTGAPMSGQVLNLVRPILRNRFRSWIASAIEARRAETGTGSVEDESAAPEGGDAKSPNPSS